jgi:hypothetical protein
LIARQFLTMAARSIAALARRAVRACPGHLFLNKLFVVLSYCVLAELGEQLASTATAASDSVQISKLSNGLTVATKYVSAEHASQPAYF